MPRSGSSAQNSSANRRVGRPRANGKQPDGDVAAQILAAAAVLFVKQGYNGTSTRQIAAAVGLRQGSLIHYFARKQDILTTLVTRTLRPAFDHAETLAESDFPAEVRFYRFVHSDCLALCRDELNITSLALQPETLALEIPELSAQREALREIYRSMIAEADRLGTFCVPDIGLATDASFAMVESIASWYSTDSEVSAEDCANHVAGTIVAGLLTESAGLEQIIARAAQAPGSVTQRESSLHHKPS